MRLLVVNWQDRLNPWAGGAEIHLHEIFGRLVDRGHDVSLLVSSWPGAPTRELVDGMRVVRTGSRYTFPLFARRAFDKVIGTESIDLVVEDINKLPLFTTFWSDLPVVCIVPHLFGTTAFLQESWPVAAMVWVAERLMPRAYRDVPFEVISHSTAADMVSRGFDAGRIRVSYPGLDHETFRPADNGERYSEPTIAYVGRLRKYKGIDVVLRALALLKTEGRFVRFLIVGRGDDHDRLRSYSERLGLSEQVEFRGFVSEAEKISILQCCWCNVYPSPKEGWGIANVEAAACGTPTVASDSPGLRESVDNGVSGFLVPHGDEGAWADRIGRICSDRELRERMGTGGIRHASCFTWEATARETESILLSALER